MKEKLYQLELTEDDRKNLLQILKSTPLSGVYEQVKGNMAIIEGLILKVEKAEVKGGNRD